jgi:hypothetical protein
MSSASGSEERAWVTPSIAHDGWSWLVFGECTIISIRHRGRETICHCREARGNLRDRVETSDAPGRMAL